MTTVQVIISGRVQGVFFRASTQEKAQSLGLSGWVRNREDGTVEALFQGNDVAINSILTWCQIGSPASRVSSVDTETITDAKRYHGFECRL